MNVSKKFSLLPMFLALILSSCGGGGVGGDADLNVVRTVFAVGEVVEALEDGGSVEGDVSTNDQGNNLVFALVSGSSVVNGDLVFNDDGTFVYTPFPDFFGEDSVDYTVTDSVSGETDSATLTISVANDFEVIEEYGYVLDSCCGSFYIPSCIMVFVYIKIYYAARERARRVINKPGLAKRVSRRFTGKSNTAASAANTAASVAAANKKG